MGSETRTRSPVKPRARLLAQSPSRLSAQSLLRSPVQSPAGSPDKNLLEARKRYAPLLWWIAIIVVLYFLIGWSTGAVGITACPDRVKGPQAEKANLTIMYFGNPFCVYCWIEDPIMERLSEKNKDILRYEHYDNRYCTNHTNAYGIFAVPGFVFNVSSQGVHRAVTHIGFLTERYVSQVICDTTGSCGGLNAIIPEEKTGHFKEGEKS